MTFDLEQELRGFQDSIVIINDCNSDRRTLHFTRKMAAARGAINSEYHVESSARPGFALR